MNLLAMSIASLYGGVLWRRTIFAPETLAMAGTFPVGFVVVLFLLLVVADQIGLVFWVPLGVAWIAVEYGMVRDCQFHQRFTLGISFVIAGWRRRNFNENVLNKQERTS